MNEVETSPATHITPGIPTTDERFKPTSDSLEYFRQYARERPEVVALWCLGIGFVVGWKLKFW
jgi:hypothetical protein